MFDYVLKNAPLDEQYDGSADRAVDEALTQLMSDRWVSFVRTCDPDCGTEPRWTPAGPDSCWLWLDEHSRMVTEPDPQVALLMQETADYWKL